MLAFTDYSKYIKKAICVISHLKRLCAQKILCVLCTLGIYIVFDNWLTLHQGWYCDKNTIVLKDKNYAYPCGHCTVITADRHPFHSLSSVSINKINTNNAMNKMLSLQYAITTDGPFLASIQKGT